MFSPKIAMFSRTLIYRIFSQNSHLFLKKRTMFFFRKFQNLIHGSKPIDPTFFCSSTKLVNQLLPNGTVYLKYPYISARDYRHRTRRHQQCVPYILMGLDDW